MTIDTYDRRAQSLVERVDLLRLEASRRLHPRRRAELGQFFTPRAVACLMASMFDMAAPKLRLLDAGAGIGSLTAAWVAEACSRESQCRPRDVHVTAYELDPMLAGYLEDTFAACRACCAEAGIRFIGEILQEDFVDAGTAMLSGSLFATSQRQFDHAILNPPYGKIHSASKERRLLRSIGVETSNLYTGFLAIVTRLLAPGGELVTITPRSFCNGPYFRPFRLTFLDTMKLRRIHVFDQRDRAFRDDQVLQENIIVHATKRNSGTDVDRYSVTITSSSDPDDPAMTVRDVPYEQVVRLDDPHAFIHIVADDVGGLVAERMEYFSSSLDDLGLTVSTGRVVDFRAEQHLRANPTADTVPLIYPMHLRDGRIDWPKPGGRKPNALALTYETADLPVPTGWYVLVKRFSAKEERRRVVAAVYEPGRISAPLVAFENHLNYFHQNGYGLPVDLAHGLAAFLNSTLVDEYFRQFNGHTQVNATDLRSLRYPSLANLTALGRRIGDAAPTQDQLDRVIEQELLHMAETPDPVQVKRRIEEGITILRSLGLPRAQQNERSALTLLALVDLGADDPWDGSRAVLRGVTPMMEFMAEQYGKRYAPNTRETVRRQSVHQFLDAGLIIANPDNPQRPINSGRTVYQITPDIIALLRTFGTPDWERSLRAYLTSSETLARRYAQEREMQRIPVRVAPGTEITLSPGGQNVLIEQIIHEFCSRFTPAGKVVYVGDTDEKWGYFDEDLLSSLGVSFDPHGKMPDVVVYHEAKSWLVLIEAVTSHGPVDPKRRLELQALFGGAHAGLVFVTAFLDRRAMTSYLDKISWETEVWVADAPAHMIHFNGERLLGPH